MMTMEERLRRLEALNRNPPPTSPFLAIPGLVGFWPLNNVDVSSGDAYDLSGQGRRLTFNGNPDYNVYQDFVQYLDFDGTGDYLSRTDESDLDITGTESHNATAIQGLTMGGWFWSDSIATQYALMGKFLATGNQRSYWMQFFGSNLVASVSSDGTAITNTTHTTTLSSNAWYFCIARYDPSTSLDAIVNDSEISNTSSIPASIFVSTADFGIGAWSGGTFPINGRASLCFLSANYLSDAWCSYLFNSTRAYFGV
jgi:hypothetical protein